MKCPRCGSYEDKVNESRSLADSNSIRRRRLCLACGYRFTSYERIEEKPLMVVKSSGRREPFDKEKLERGVRRAVEKRNISTGKIDDLLDEIEDAAERIGMDTHEVSSRQLGDLVLQKLYSIDHVAYIRFASVYRKFENLEEFIEEIKHLRT